MTADILTDIPHEEEGSGAVCLLVLAFGILVFAVVFSVLAFNPHGSSLGAMDRPAVRPTTSSDR